VAGDYAALLGRLDGLRHLGVDFGLDRVQRALAALGAPEQRLPAVQIAGTNGKGSTAAMTEAILRAAGWRTGLYTSPHLSRFTERIRVDGAEVDGDRLARLDAAIVETGVPLTYFEVATVLAFLALAQDRVDLAVLETGLGGRLDAVTACRPLATAITSIGWDHMDYLGSTLREIAREKAGILKPGVPCFLARLPAEADEEIARVAAEVGAPLRRLGVDFEAPQVEVEIGVDVGMDVGVDIGADVGAAGAGVLRGAHQRSNAALAVALASEAGRRRGRPIPPQAIAAGLAAVRWPGRLETISDDLLLDCAHNPEGAQALAAALPALISGRHAALVISVVEGKDLAGLLRPLLPLFSLVVATRSHNPRARAPGDLAAAIVGLIAAWAAAARTTPVPVIVNDDALAAVTEARHWLARASGTSGTGGTASLVVVAGSIFLIGDVRAALLGERRDPRAVSDPL
jgi:dihydrofolate synthase / folylpolyglutamate synthase